MEERLLKILKRNINAMPLSSGNRITGIYPTAKEITALIQSEYVEKEFARWALAQGTAEFADYYEFWLKEVKGVKQ